MLGSARALSGGVQINAPDNEWSRTREYPPTRPWSSSATPCPTSGALLRKSRRVQRLPDCGRWM
eukprot:4998886-Alexandrium_andersonii.AAC.1